MRKIAFLAMGLLLSYVPKAQSLSPNIISSGGGVSSSSEITLEWTLGESSVGVANGIERLYTIGFHQPILMSTSLARQNSNRDKLSSQVNVYPNPAASMLHVQFQLAKYEKVKMVLTDLLGRTLRQKDVYVQSTTTDVYVSDLASGIYVLSIMDVNGVVIQSFKITKAN